MKLTLEQLVAKAEQLARIRYDGKVIEHRSCGIAIAETFGRETAAYQSLRKGGITGEGHCGAIQAGTLVLGELFGDPNPAGKTTDALKAAVERYNTLWPERVNTGSSSSTICRAMTSQFDAFSSPERHAFCTAIAESVAGCIAQVVGEMKGDVSLKEIDEV